MSGRKGKGKGCLEKMPTGIPGFDLVTDGGLPRGRTTLVAGSAGSAKTVLAVQFLAHGIAGYDQPGVFVTFEESPEDIRRNMQGFGWPIARWESEKKWSFPYRGYGRAWTEAFGGECGERLKVDLKITEVSKKRGWSFPYQGHGYAWPRKGVLTLTLLS